MGPALLGIIYAASSDLYQLPYAAAALSGALGMTLFIVGGKIIKQKSNAWPLDRALKVRRSKGLADNIFAYNVIVF